MTPSAGGTPRIDLDCHEGLGRSGRGTTGTPTVSTQTDVNLRDLDVQSVRPLGDRCELR
jgi:hypothetical protein